MSMFRCATFLFAVAKVYLFLHSANFSLFFFEEQSKILGSTGKSVSAGELDNNRTYGFTLDFFSTTDWTDKTDLNLLNLLNFLNLYLGHKTKT